jgi:hypothetical protein
MPRNNGQRGHLLAAGAEFVRVVRQIKGVRGISLIGSICTARTDPKDIDFVIEIADDVDWEQLAARGRRLKGRAQEAAAFEAPAVTLWPESRRRVALPKDVEAFLAAFEKG